MVFETSDAAPVSDMVLFCSSMSDVCWEVGSVEEVLVAEVKPVANFDLNVGCSVLDSASSFLAKSEVKVSHGGESPPPVLATFEAFLPDSGLDSDCPGESML